MPGIMDWAQIGQQANPSGYPVNGAGLAPDQASYWQGNQLQIPGLGALLNVGVAGGAGTGGIPNGGGGGGGGAGPLPPPPSGGGGGSGSGLNQGSINAAYLYQKRPDVYNAYQGLGDDDYAWIEKKGYAPTYGGFAQYWFDTYRDTLTQNFINDILNYNPAANTGGNTNTGGGTSSPPVTPTDPLNPIGRPVIPTSSGLGGGGSGGLASYLR